MLMYLHDVLKSNLLLDIENNMLARCKDACFKVFIEV